MLRRRREVTLFPNGPVFPNSLGGLRDPSNTRRDIRKARGGDEFAWVTSHVFRKTAATILDEAGLSARVVADQLGHARPSMTQDTYLARKAVDRKAAGALERALDRAEQGEPPALQIESQRLKRIKGVSALYQCETPRPVTWGFGGPPGTRTLNPKSKSLRLALFVDLPRQCSLPVWMYS
ncbi:phage integrase family protein [Lentzea atacamensis]|uniref:Phage integrase family protein n=2 Tax=Lentzea atacamensis TaxID=531938 RepID=A0ABX9ECU0_9PSEU|nr:phage integrase family protein [Lentzea atacamensis]